MTWTFDSARNRADAVCAEIIARHPALDQRLCMSVEAGQLIAPVAKTRHPEPRVSAAVFVDDWTVWCTVTSANGPYESEIAWDALAEMAARGPGTE